MKTVITLVGAFLLLQTARCQETFKEVGTNSLTMLAMLPKATPPLPRFSLAPLLLRMPVPAQLALHGGTNLLLASKPFQREKSPTDPSDKEPPLTLVPAEKEFMPNLYYCHLERWAKSEEEADIFGRIWKLSPRTELIFPFCRWDYPSVRGERFLVGVSLSWKSR